MQSTFGVTWRVGATLLCLLISFAGCSRNPVLEFTPSSDIAELPERHQENIATGMLRLFGTPVNPRLRAVDPDAPEPEDAPETEEGEEQPAALPALIDVAVPEHLKHGAKIYMARCSGCHGISGDGAGPAGEHLRPRPRDYRKGIFKFTSTPYGAKPARHDLVRTIRRGAKGTSMPGFPWMSVEDLDAVVDYVVYLSRRGEVESDVVLMAGEYFEDEDVEFSEFSDAVESSTENWQEAETQVVLPVTAKPKYDEESVTKGRELFLAKACSSCHGVDGKGQVEWINPEFLAKLEAQPEDQREKINYDAWGEPAPAADLTARMLHGGRRPIDIYRRIHTGINGTPMPAFGDLFSEEPESIWHLVHYVTHIIEGGDPTVGITSVPEADTSGEMETSDETSEIDASEDTEEDVDDAAEEATAEPEDADELELEPAA